VVEDELDPPAAVGFGLGDVTFHDVEGGRQLHRIRRVGPVQVDRRELLGVGTAAAGARGDDVPDPPGGVVAAGRDDLLGGEVGVPVGVGEVADREALVQQGYSVVADLALLLVGVERRQVGVAHRVAADLVAVALQAGQLRLGHVPVQPDPSRVDEERRVHRVVGEERPRLVLVGVGVVERQGDDDRRMGVGQGRRGLRRLGTSHRRDGGREQGRACKGEGRGDGLPRAPAHGAASWPSLGELR
jgi:hypothetical protein